MCTILFSHSILVILYNKFEVNTINLRGSKPPKKQKEINQYIDVRTVES